ncbi:hypothetical protein MUG78_17110 [Gordonia alkaliphila]|uniref:hypothetical protein n=1 Tax=Gordonia alkaliphila TaxID=1053547 RepID=UPI001FF36BF6|nr:hypothetical protein [Gordonia alkaliphila]MCK0441121.1 hypothetical protein [Gordonia alkaliphila]
MAIEQWTPERDSPEIVLALGTNPWLADNSGTIIDLTAVSGTRSSECGQCAPIPGVVAPVDTEFGIQRCDECSIYAGDFEAAFALAQYLNPEYVVMYEAVG